jgi:hypothetical protein
MRMKTQILALASCVAVLGVAAMATRADTVTATFNGLQWGGTVYVASNYNDSLAGTANNAYVDVYTGIYGFTETSPGSNLPLNAVCVDVAHNIYGGNSGTYNVVPVDQVGTINNGVGISPLQAVALGYLAGSLPTDLSTVTNDAAGIFQMAVWDLLYNGGGTYSGVTGQPAPTISFTSYSLSADGIQTAANYAADAYAEAKHNPSGTGVEGVLALVNTDNLPLQSFMLVIGGTATPLARPVPLPASAGVGFVTLALFGALFVIRKRLSRRAQIA